MADTDRAVPAVPSPAAATVDVDPVVSMRKSELLDMMKGVMAETLKQAGITANSAAKRAVGKLPPHLPMIASPDIGTNARLVVGINPDGSRKCKLATIAEHVDADNGDVLLAVAGESELVKASYLQGHSPKPDSDGNPTYVVGTWHFPNDERRS